MGLGTRLRGRLGFGARLRAWLGLGAGLRAWLRAWLGLGVRYRCARATDLPCAGYARGEDLARKSCLTQRLARASACRIWGALREGGMRDHREVRAGGSLDGGTDAEDGPRSTGARGGRFSGEIGITDGGARGAAGSVGGRAVPRASVGELRGGGTRERGAGAGGGPLALQARGAELAGGSSVTLGDAVGPAHGVSSGAGSTGGVGDRGRERAGLLRASTVDHPGRVLALRGNRSLVSRLTFGLALGPVRGRTRGAVPDARVGDDRGHGARSRGAGSGEGPRAGVAGGREGALVPGGTHRGAGALAGYGEEAGGHVGVFDDGSGGAGRRDVDASGSDGEASVDLIHLLLSQSRLTRNHFPNTLLLGITRAPRARIDRTTIRINVTGRGRSIAIHGSDPIRRVISDANEGKATYGGALGVASGLTKAPESRNEGSGGIKVRGAPGARFSYSGAGRVGLTSGLKGESAKIFVAMGISISLIVCKAASNRPRRRPVIVDDVHGQVAALCSIIDRHFEGQFFTTRFEGPCERTIDGSRGRDRVRRAEGSWVV